MVLGVPQRPGALLDRLADTVLVDALLEVGQLVGDVDLPVRRGRVSRTSRSRSRLRRVATEEKISPATSPPRPRGNPSPHTRRRRRTPDIPRSRPVRPPTGCRPACCPGTSARCATSANSTRSVTSPSSRRPCATRRTAAPIPSRSQTRSNVHTTQAARVQHLHVRVGGGGDRLLRGQEPRDRRHQTGQRGPVDVLGTAEVVDHLGSRVTGLRVPLVVRQLQVPHNRPISVGPPRFPHVMPTTALLLVADASTVSGESHNRPSCDAQSAAAGCPRRW
jgi:hypothetical protein